MESFTVHTGRVACLARDDIDTDQIVPARYCKRISRTGFADALFADWRADPDFVLNDPRAAGATILVAGANFGTGSSREHAVWALRDYGFRAVISAKFGDIFHSNSLKNGLLPVILPPPSVATLFTLAGEEPGLELTIDLVAAELSFHDERWSFTVERRAREMIIRGSDEIDITLQHADTITDFERRRPDWMPVLSPGETARRTAKPGSAR